MSAAIVFPTCCMCCDALRPERWAVADRPCAECEATLARMAEAQAVRRMIAAGEGPPAVSFSAQRLRARSALIRAGGVR